MPESVSDDDFSNKYSEIFERCNLEELIQARNYLGNSISQLWEEQGMRVITTGANTLIFVEKVDDSFGTPYRYFESIASIPNPFYEKKINRIKDSSFLPKK